MAEEFDDQQPGQDANEATGELAQLDALIAADEQAEAAQKAAAGEQAARRDAGGRFTGAGQGQRAGQRQTPEEISAADAKAKAGVTAAKPKAEATPTTTTQPKDAKAPGGENQQQQQQPKAGDAPGDEGKSRYEKAKEREAKAWQEVNKAKDELAAKTSELDLREKAIAMREQGHKPPPQGEPKAHGFTAAQWAAAATDWEAKGEFEKADSAREVIKELQQQAKSQQGNGHGPNLTASWQRLRSDLPELFNPSNPLNAEMRALLEAEPGLLADDAGPYRAAIRTGRKAIAKLEQEVARHKTEAAQVPGLQQKLSELSARVKELEAATSITDSGGAMNRGSGGGEKPFAELTTDQMGAQLDREFATALG